MRIKRTAVLIFTVALLLCDLTGCGGNGREVNVDTGLFGNGGTSIPSGTFNGTTNGAPGGSDPLSGTGTLSLEQALANGAATRYQRAVLYDQTLGCEAVRSFMPDGWTVGGGVYWNMQSAARPAAIDFYIVSPDNAARAGYVSPMSYAQPDPSYQLSEGQWYAGALCPVKTYQNAETFVRAFFQGYIGTADIQLLDTIYPAGKMAAAQDNWLAYQNSAMEQLTAQLEQGYAASGATFQRQAGIEGATDILRFEISGVVYKAKAYAAIYSERQTISGSLPMMGQFTEQTLLWGNSIGFFYYFAEERKFDEYEAIADVFFSNLIPNAQWQTAVSEAINKIFQDELNRRMENAERILKALQQQGLALASARPRDYSQSSGSSGYDSTVIDGWTNAITGHSYYESSDGGAVLLDDSYTYTYNDGGGGFVQSDNPIQGLTEATNIGTQPPGGG